MSTTNDTKILFVSFVAFVVHNVFVVFVVHTRSGSSVGSSCNCSS